jgi:hypothetical protein
MRLSEIAPLLYILDFPLPSLCRLSTPMLDVYPIDVEELGERRYWIGQKCAG